MCNPANDRCRHGQERADGRVWPGYSGYEAAFRRGLARLLFAVLECHPDNGSQFFNQHIGMFGGGGHQWGDAIGSRPYEKNDNRMWREKQPARAPIRASPAWIQPGKRGR